MPVIPGSSYQLHFGTDFIIVDAQDPASQLQDGWVGTNQAVIDSWPPDPADSNEDGVFSPYVTMLLSMSSAIRVGPSTCMPPAYMQILTPSTVPPEMAHKE